MMLLSCLSLSLDVNMLTVGESLFGMVLQANFVVFWECDYLGNMVGANVLIEMVFEVVLRKTVEVI